MRSYCLEPEEYDDAREKIRLPAAELGDRDRKLLMEIRRAALAAAASIDPDDYETPVGHRVYLGDLHYCYRVLSSMVEEILREKNTEEKPETFRIFRSNLK